MAVTMRSARDVDDKIASLRAHGTRKDLPFTQRDWQPAVTALSPTNAEIHGDSEVSTDCQPSKET